MLYPHALKSKQLKPSRTVNSRTRDKYATHLPPNPEKRPEFKKIGFEGIGVKMKLLWR